MRIARLHPGRMRAGIASCLVSAGQDVGWTPSGRSQESRERAGRAGLRDGGDLASLVTGSDLVLSICPPHAARQVAEDVAGAGFAGIYVDANAVAPSTARSIAAVVEAAGASYVDGGIVGEPPSDHGPRLFLSGASAPKVAPLFDATGSSRSSPPRRGTSYGGGPAGTPATPAPASRARTWPRCRSTTS
jgi:3-hydroxyisobutyrate dehydrogenase-like beta-hydroxyacid dehydrogenase